MNTIHGADKLCEECKEILTNQGFVLVDTEGNISRTPQQELELGDFELIKTCGACPEQYDLFRNGEQVAYLRLRHGYFYCAVPDVEGEVIYETETQGDGCFKDEERNYHLNKALKAVRDKLQIYY